MHARLPPFLVPVALCPVLALCPAVLAAAPGARATAPAPRTDRVFVAEAAGCPDDVVAVDLRVENPNIPIDAFTVRIEHDPAVLWYHHCERGDLDPGWILFSCGQGSVDFFLVGGFTNQGFIPPGSAGTIARLFFRVARPAVPARDATPVHIAWAIDDLTGFETGDGVFTRLACAHTGDVNADGELSAGDAQAAFGIALGGETPACDVVCRADCTGDGQVTAADAQAIFAAALGYGQCAEPLP